VPPGETGVARCGTHANRTKILFDTSDQESMRKAFFAGPTSVRVGILAAASLLGALCVHAWMQLRPAAGPGTATSFGNSSGPPPALPVSDPASLHLFGLATTPVISAPVAPPPNLLLTGLIAGRPGRPAVALLMVDGKPQALRPGDSLASGWTLVQVLRDRVVLDQNGQRSELELLPMRGAVGGGVAGSVPMPAGVAPNPPAGAVPSALRMGGTGIAPAPFRLEVQSLGPNHLGFSKAELNHALQDPHSAASLGRATPAPGGGLLIDEVPPGSLPDRIGLRSGDVLHQANGQALNNLTDLPRLYQEFGSAAAVRLELVRGGQPTTLQYSVRP
jgi:general secretion pathway protein C